MMSAAKRDLEFTKRQFAAVAKAGAGQERGRRMSIPPHISSTDGRGGRSGRVAWRHRLELPSGARGAAHRGRQVDRRQDRRRDVRVRRASLSHAAEVRRHADRSRHHPERPLRRLREERQERARLRLDADGQRVVVAVARVVLRSDAGRDEGAGGPRSRHHGRAQAVRASDRSDVDARGSVSRRGGEISRARGRCPSRFPSCAR